MFQPTVLSLCDPLVRVDVVRCQEGVAQTACGSPAPTVQTGAEGTGTSRPIATNTVTLIIS